METARQEGLWAPPVPCRWCDQPMPRGLARCPLCEAPTGAAPFYVLGRAAERSVVLSLDLMALVAGAGILLLLLPLSPVLVLFPLLFVGWGPPRRRRVRRAGRRRRKATGPP